LAGVSPCKDGLAVEHPIAGDELSGGPISFVTGRFSVRRLMRQNGQAQETKKLPPSTISFEASLGSLPRSRSSESGREKLIDLSSARSKLSRFESEVVSGIWRGANKRFPIGSVHERPVTNTATFGVFVELELGLDGLIHSSKLPMDFRANEAFGHGQMVHVSILSVDRVERRVELDWIRPKATPEGFRDRSAQH